MSDPTHSYGLRKSHRDEYQERIDPGADSASEELLWAVATVRDTDPCELPPLTASIDPEALDGLVNSLAGGASRTADSHVCFTYAGLEVRIAATGTMTLSPVE